jgi:hypothetical protein
VPRCEFEDVGNVGGYLDVPRSEIVGGAEIWWVIGCVQV